MQIFIPIILNIVYPGSGYLYLKDDFRKTIAKFLVFVWTYVLVNVIFALAQAFSTGNFYLFNSGNSFSNDFFSGIPNEDILGIPSLAWGMWGFMIYDTYNLAKSKVRSSTRKVVARH